MSGPFVFLGMPRISLSILLFFVISPAYGQGTIIEVPEFSSELVPDRQLEIYLPPDYDGERSEGYPVLYMHDGQNVFNPGSAYGGKEWGVDEALDTLIPLGKVPPIIVVAIWNAKSKRTAEFMPQDPYDELPDSIQAIFLERANEPPYSNNYLRFLVEEVKPYIDATYNTDPSMESTGVMGSSFGGLISFYAITKYPHIFSRAGCVSTHWIVAFNDDYPILPHTLTDWFADRLPQPFRHRLWFDYGTITLDMYYEPFQQRMDAYLEAGGYTKSENWMTKKYEGAAHNEPAWNARVDEMLEFLWQE